MLNKNLCCVRISKETGARIGRDFPCTKSLYQNVYQKAAWVVNV